jgi:hypothetical protein
VKGRHPPAGGRDAAIHLLGHKALLHQRRRERCLLPTVSLGKAGHKAMKKSLMNKPKTGAHYPTPEENARAARKSKKAALRKKAAKEGAR